MAAPGRDQRPLAGRSAWIFTTGAAGMDAQTRGVADALGLDYEMKRVRRGASSSCWRRGGPSPRRSASAKPARSFAPPWPDVAIALGRVQRALHACAAPALPEHILDRHARQPRGAGRRRRHLGAAARSPARAERHHHADRAAQLHRRAARRLRQELPGDIAALPPPRIAVILGGKNKVYEFRPADDARFAASLRSLGALGASFMITPSRRTHARLLGGDGGSDTRLPAHPVGWRGRQSLSASFLPMPMPSSSLPTAST